MCDDLLIAAFSDSVAARMGLHFPVERRPELWRGVCHWAEASGKADPADCMREWLAAPASRLGIESLARHLSVGETYFFREPASFQLLESQVLPALIAARRRSGRRLRIWSAGCASGEEVYSLAIVLDRLIPDIAQWDLRIVGSDIHPELLAAARDGVYGEWSFRGAPALAAGPHFEPAGPQRVKVREALKQQVDFRFFNLADPVGPPATTMDLVLCRHVLMYFEPQQARRLIARLQRCLAPDGWLVVGGVEAGHRCFDGFAAPGFGSGAFHRKQVGGDRPAPAPAVAPAPPPAVPPASMPSSERSRLEAILIDCRSALASDRCNAELHHLEGLVHEALGDYEEARHALRRVLFLDPDCAVAHLALGRLCESEGQAARAARHVANGLALLRRRTQGSCV